MMNSLRFSAVAVIATLIYASPVIVNAQGGCIEIRSILVDACGSPEGENEMVRFDVGNAPLNVSNMTVNWPNNSFQGLCQDATTASIVSGINQNIIGCGLMSEPVGGILPANSKVLLLTSVNINTVENSFVNLNDTVIVLFQCANNTSGHFANYNINPGLRTLSITFGGPAGCTDSVTYERSMLVNQFGVTGGFTFENDGSFVSFTDNGTATYLNNGCQVLSSGLSLTGGPDVGICPGGSVIANLNGAGANLTGPPQWTGGTGNFADPNSLTTTYTPGPGETGLVPLVLSGSGPCNAFISDTVFVNIVTSMPSVTISSNVSGTFFSNVTDSIYFYNWYPDGSSNFIPGAFNPEFTPNANGCYYMVLSTIGGCESTSNVLCITNVGIGEHNENFFISTESNPGSNPVIGITAVKPVGRTNISIVDVTGRLILQRQENIPGGFTRMDLNLQGIDQGIYFVRISGGGWKATSRIIITR